MESGWTESLPDFHNDYDIWLAWDVMLVLKWSKLWQGGQRWIVEALAQRCPPWSNRNTVVQHKGTHDNEETRSGSPQRLHWTKETTSSWRRHSFTPWCLVDHRKQPAIIHPSPSENISYEDALHGKLLSRPAMALPHSNTLNRET